MTNLAEEVRIWNELKNRLILEYELDPEDEALMTSVEGETNLNDRLAAMLRYAKQSEKFAEALAGIVKDNQSRKKRLEERAERLRANVAWALQETGQRKLEAPDLSASLSSGKAKLIIIDEQEAINHGWIKKREPEIDRATLKDALASGLECSYATLESNVPPILSVRTK